MATHGLGSWMAPRGCSDFWWRGKYFAPAGNLDSFLGRLARSVRQVGSFKTEVNKYIIRLFVYRTLHWFTALISQRHMAL